MNDRVLGGISLLVLLVACLVGGVVVYGQNQRLEQVSEELRLTRVQAQRQAVGPSPQDVPAAVPPEVREPSQAGSAIAPAPAAMPSPESLKPTVAYLRQGLLTEADKQMLARNLVEPISDYHNATTKQVVAILIEVPIAMNAPYGVTMISANGGTAQFSYGMRGKDAGYWLPDCADQGDCSFSDAFKRKYPTIVSRYPEVRDGVSAE